MLTVKDKADLNDKAVVMCGSFCSKYKWEKSTDDENNWSTLTETGSVLTVTLDELKDADYKCTLDSSCGIKHEANKNTPKYDTIWFDYKTYGYEKVINDYDLVLFTLRSNQAGTYKCKAVSLSDPKKHVTLREL